MKSDKAVVERRKEPRHEIWIDAKVIGPKGSYIAAVKNISGGGMEIQLPRAIKPHTVVSVSLYLNEEFVFRGVSVWTIGDYINNQWIHRVGIKTKEIVFSNRQVEKPQEKRELVERLLPTIRAAGASRIPIGSKAA